MAKIACFGKDCEINRKTLRKYVRCFSKDTLVVGVETFKDICRQAGVRCIYIPRESNQAVHLCQRLGQLLSVDMVVALPVRGRMTKVELAMAKESGFEIQEFN